MKSGIISGRAVFTVSLLFFLIACAVPALAAPLTGAGSPLPDGRVADSLGVATFIPPPGWIRWDSWGIAAFSPGSLRAPRLTFVVTKGDFSNRSLTDAAIRRTVKALSTDNYKLIGQENLYLEGWYGIRVLAQGTEKNILFGRDYIWLQDYFTADRRISLVFHSGPDSFETYREAVLAAFRSLVVTERRQDGQ